MTVPARKRKTRHHSRSAKAGLAPGTMVFVGEHRSDPVRVDVINYNESSLTEVHDVSVDQCRELAQTAGVTWINVTGVHKIELIAELGQCLELHPLTQEDIVNTAQRPKTEEFPNYIYAVLKMFSFDEAAGRLEIEHLSLIFGENYVVSFHEKDGDVFNSVRQRIRNARGRIRARHADYLAYALMDAVVDHYFLAVERIGDRIEDLDEKIFGDLGVDTMHQAHRLKRDTLSLRKAVWPLREEIGAMYKSESALIRPETKVFLRDLYDHTIQVIDTVETFRDMLGGIHDIYLSSVSNRMNEVMKVLTIIATVFIPLTFIAGVYGMNFDNMPELSWQYGYPLVAGFMLAIALGMLGFFRRKKWI